MIHDVKVSTSLDAAEEECCVSIFRSIMRSYNLLHTIGIEIADKFDLHIAEINVIDMLGKHGSMSMGELSRVTFVAPSSTTRTVKQLEMRGYVKRERSSESERVVTVSLTREGKNLFKKTYPTILTAVQGCLEQSLNRSERRKLVQLLEKLEG